MYEKRFLPDIGRVGVLTAIAMISFALVHLIPVPGLKINYSIFGITLAFQIKLSTLLALITAGIVATGMNWLLRTHPSLKTGEFQEHWLLPTLTVFIIGIALDTLKGNYWWFGFFLSLTLLVLILLAEYIVVDPSDQRYHLATALLTSLAYVNLLILATSLDASNGRLFLLAPALFFSSFLVSLRTLHLYVHERWEIMWAAGIGFLSMHIGTVIHYLPLSPARFGIIFISPVYFCTNIAAFFLNNIPFRRVLVSLGFAMTLFIYLLIFLK